MVTLAALLEPSGQYGAPGLAHHQGGIQYGQQGACRTHHKHVEDWLRKRRRIVRFSGGITVCMG